MKRYFLIPLFSIVTLLAPVTHSRVVCPRVTSEHTADMSDWRRFRNFHQWQDKTDGELALAVWRYLCGYETGVYHFNEILEGDDPFLEYATVRDPLKILNVYNMGYCGIFGAVLDGIFQNIGFEKGRAFGIDLWNHSATEVFYNDQWHYFDLDVRGVLLDETGDVISLQEAQTQKRYWVDPPVPIQPFFPNDPNKEKVFKIYRNSKVNYYYRWFEGSHTMDLVLRQGESFTRWWNPQGGRWNHRPKYNQIPWVVDLLQEEPKGMKPNHRHFTRWNHGNGLFQYTPNLTDQSTDFMDGVYSSHNIQPGKHGLEIIQDGPAEVVFEVFTPYIIVAKINDLKNISDDEEASVVSWNAEHPIKISISRNRGKTWNAVGVFDNSQNQVDLTQWVKGTYGYLVKLSMDGEKGDTALRALTIDTWVQVAPISLPRLKQGTNHLQFSLGDRYGKQTEPILITPDTANPDDIKHYLTQIPQDYDPDRHTERIRGEAILLCSAPEGKKIEWLSVGAAFRTHQGEYASQTNNQIDYAVNQPENFKKLYRASVPTWVNHWRYNWDADIRLDQPAEKVYIKYIGDPGVNTMRACLHVTPRHAPSQEIAITHGFKINNQLYTKKVTMKHPDNYTITCEDKPENLFIKLAVPSDPGS